MISNSFTSYSILLNSSKFDTILKRSKKKINVVEIKNLFFFRYDCSTTCSSLRLLNSSKKHYLFIVYLKFGVLCPPWKLMNDDLCKFKGALSNGYLVVFLFFLFAYFRFCSLFLLFEF